jgi:hypothetical protein
LSWIFRILFFLIGQRAKVQIIREAKKHGVLAYLKMLQGSRRVLMVALAAFLILQLMLLSLVGALVSGFMLWDTDFQFKMQVLFGMFLALFALPFIGLLILFSERLWYKASGAQKMVEDLQAGHTSDRNAA